MLQFIKIIFKLLFKIQYYTVGKKSKIEYPKKIINPHKDKNRIVIGANSIIKCEIQLLGHGGSIYIGDYCYIGEHSYLWSGDRISLGDRVLIGHGCNIYDNDIHPLNSELRHEQFKDIITVGQPVEINLNDSEVMIEDDVWIGANVTILKGVTIGKAAIIGANSVVTKSIQPHTVNVGNPTKIVNRLSTEKNYN